MRQRNDRFRRPMAATGGRAREESPCQSEHVISRLWERLDIATPSQIVRLSNFQNTIQTVRKLACGRCAVIFGKATGLAGGTIASQANMNERQVLGSGEPALNDRDCEGNQAPAGV